MESLVIDGKWKLVKKIGQGGYGYIYAAIDILTNRHVAIKLEKPEKRRQALKLEIQILTAMQGSPYACKLIHSGRDHDYNYMVMDLLGKSMSQIRRRMPGKRFSLQTTLRLGIHMISSIEHVHRVGFVHRDIKASNFVLKKNIHDRSGPIFCIIDFGLAKPYKHSDGRLIAERNRAGFRGTARYASVNAHKGRDLGRNDDLLCLFYLLIEFAVGKLPWSHIKDKEKISEVKIKYTESEEILNGLPEEFRSYFHMINALSFSDEPDYVALRQIFSNAFIKYNLDRHAKFDWEVLRRTRKPINTGITRDFMREVKEINDIELPKHDPEKIRKLARGEGGDFSSPAPLQIAKSSESISEIAIRNHIQVENSSSETISEKACIKRCCIQ